MSQTNGVRRRWRLVLAGAATAVMALTMVNPASAEPSNGPSDDRTSEEKAMQRQQGIPRAEAQKRLKQQGTLSATAKQLTSSLGQGRTGGAYIDAETGKLVVTVTKKADAAEVEAAGGTAKVVSHSAKRLDNTRGQLDDLARSEGAGSVQGWYVDVRTNSVVVTTTKGSDDASARTFVKQAKSLGQEVRVESTTAKVVPVAEDLYGGQQVEMDGYICSSGFNATLASGEVIMLTAGHCAEGNPSFSRDGVTIGATYDFSFPDNDYAAVEVDTAAWNARGAVDTYDGNSRQITGNTEAPVGASVCKSGRTSSWTCGTIEATEQTVNYGEGDVVSGLVRHSACVEQGDSGGSNVAGNDAQGMSSGGQLFDQGGELVCGEKVGQPNVSFYQPVTEALEAYGATLVTE